MYLNLNCDWFFAVISRKYKTWTILDILMTNSERKHDNFTNDPIFSSTLSSLSVCTFHFCISGPWKFSSMRFPFALSSGLQNTLSHAKDDTLKPAGIYIFFFYRKFANFWYITCFVLSMITNWPQSHGLN